MPKSRKRTAEHSWHIVNFTFRTYTECECGYQPTSQEDMDQHYVPVEA